MRYAHKIDSNQPTIVNAFRVAGASVDIVSMIPKKLDLIIGVAGIDQRVEIKDGALPPSKQKLTDDEQEIFDTWQGRPPVIIKTPEEATALVFRMKMEAHECVSK